MKILKPSAILILTTVGLFSSCVKERIIEKTIQPERIADKKIENSINTSQSSETIVLKKDQLGKAYLLSPTMFTSGQTPMPTFIKPMIVGFERYGNKVALYNYTDEQMYDVLPADKLLQTFKVLKESDTELVINFKEGFKSVNLVESLSIVMKESMEEMMKKISSGQESSLEIKDSFIKNIKTQNNTIYISQVIRTIDRQIETKTNPMSPATNPEKVQKLTTTESTNDYLFELKPYVENKEFKSKTFDKSQKVGFFINFKTQKQQDEPIPQISKWDISENRPPVEIRFYDQTPKEMLPLMEEGIQYWNNTFGRNVFVRGSDFKTGEIQPDRTIFVYWVPWDSAGFAVAGLQTDPLTGETLKGSVFMTSSWYKSTLNQAKLSFNTQNQDFDKFKKGNCLLEQSSFLSNEIENTANTVLAKKSALDTIRVVFTHEMGHVLGLRHNFAGSFTNEKTDDEVMAGEMAYKLGQEKVVPISTTVMDYTPPLHTAMQGAYIKANTLPYDTAAIQWGYFDKEPTLSKYSYCSDEHIMMAGKENKSIYGCERFDRYKNVFNASVQEQLRSLTHKMTGLVTQLNQTVSANNSYYADNFVFEKFLGSSGFLFDSIPNNLENYLYVDSQNTKLFSIPSIIDNTLNSLRASYGIYDSNISEIVKKDIAAVGGYTGIIKSILELQEQANGKLFENQVVNFFDSEQVKIISDIITADQTKLLREKLLEASKRADSNFKINLIKSFPLQKKITTYDPVTKEVKSTLSKLNSSIKVDDIDFLIQLYSEVYEKSIRQTTKKVTINAQEIEVPITWGYTSDEVVASKYLFNLPLSSYETSAYSKLLEAKNKLKSIAIFKTLSVLNAQNILPVLQDSNSLTTALSSIDWTKINGLSKYDLEQEIKELKAWEDLK